MLYREPSAESSAPLAKGPSDGKSFKEVVTPHAKLSDQGLYAFSLINFAPKYNNNVPFYFQTGLIYKGLIPTRDQDQMGVAFAYGNYSFYEQEVDEEAGKPVQTYEAVLEFDYRFQINKWAYVQPVLQYFIRPNGAGLVANATVIGFQLGATF